MSSRRPRVSLTDTVPVRSTFVSTSTGTDGLVCLSQPRLRVGWLCRLFPSVASRFRASVSLERIGSCVWQNIDGRSTVAEIIDRVCRRFPDEEDLPRRISLYLMRMQRDRLITLTQPSR